MDKIRKSYIPDSPGVYIFKDKKGDILYIGKAQSLKKRVRSYFNSSQSFKMRIMVSKIAGLEYIVTRSETQARIQEAKLIKENLPAYNTAFRDDKSFPLICIGNGDFPVVWIARRTSRRLKDSVSRCFGPYPNAGVLREGLKSIRRIFGFRSCFKMPKIACLYYRLRLCPAPCIGKISVRKYRRCIRNISLFLEGRQGHLISMFAAKMRKLANDKKFEQAAVVRNQIQALGSISLQQFTSTPIGLNDKFNPNWCGGYRESAELKEVLGLNIRPQRIEAFDVSNILGTSACASMVSFYKGVPDKRNYRRFRIKGVSGIDDYRMLEEAVSRRYRRVIDEGLVFPDLIVIDGGKGQLGVVMRKLKKLGLSIPAISIAKQKDEIFILRRKAALRLKPNSYALHLIQRIRDEAHRFAVSYHRILRRKKILGE